MPKIKKPQVLSKHSKNRSDIFSLRTKILLFTGLVLLLLPLLFYLNQTIQLMYFTPKVADLPVVREQQRISPVTRIDIPKVGISLPVYRTIITNKTWGIAADGVSHLSESSNPGQEGPIILYAHNTRDRFGPIRWLNDGDIITLTTEDAKQHTYKIVERIKTSPDELSVFFKRKTETLYLFTCDGFADIDRYIVVAQPIASDSAR